MGIIVKPWTFPVAGEDTISPSKLNDNFDALFTLVNGLLDSDNIDEDVVVDDNLNKSISPVTRWDESFQDYVVTGLTVTDLGLDCTVAGGTAYVSGERVEPSSSGHTVDDNATTYCDVSYDGTFSWNANASPATGYLRLAKIVATAGACVITDMRTLTPIGAPQIESLVLFDIDSAVGAGAVNLTTSASMADLLTLDSANVKTGDILVPIATVSMTQATADATVNFGFSVDGVDQTTVYTHRLFSAANNSATKTVIGELHTVAADADALAVALRWKTSADTTTAIANGQVLTVLRLRPTG